MLFEPIQYSKLNARQKELFNFQKVSAVLADYGFMTIRLSDDWSGADFIAQHVDGKRFLKVQLKGRLTFDKKYLGRDLHICFPYEEAWYLYPHDSLLESITGTGIISKTRSWPLKGLYHFPTISKEALHFLQPYRLKASNKPVGDPDGLR